MDIRVILLLFAEAAFAFFLLYKQGELNTKGRLVASAILIAAAFALRGAVLSYETLDYQNFLTKWVDFYRENGGFSALDRSVGNYNIPYLYFMALFSCSSVKDLYLIKLLSIFFDVILAWSSMLLVSHFSKSGIRRLGVFFAVLFLPTVYLNGALWGQCDSIYVAFAVLSVYLALEDRPWLSMITIAVSFGFKLQAVFVMPVFAVLWMAKKLRWYHFLAFPAAYIVLVLPAVLCGRPFMDTLMLYFSQTGSIGDGLNYNSPSVFSFFYYLQDTVTASRLGITAAFAYMLTVLAAAFIRRNRLSDKAILIAAVLLAVGIPFLLPHMHDRYFFAADILALILAFVIPPLSAAAILTQFASLLGYHAYLKMRYLLYMDRGSAALMIVLFLLWPAFSLSLADFGLDENPDQK